MNKTPYEITINERPFWVVDSPLARDEYLVEHPEVQPSEIGYIAIAAFREQAYVDYVAVGHMDDVSGTETWTKAFEQYEWLDWMAGTVYRQREREAELIDTERRLGRFMLSFGWAPNYYLETKPSPEEFEAYIEFVAKKDEVNGQLLIPELEEGA